MTRILLADDQRDVLEALLYEEGRELILDRNRVFVTELCILEVTINGRPVLKGRPV